MDCLSMCIIHGNSENESTIGHISHWKVSVKTNLITEEWRT